VRAQSGSDQALKGFLNRIEPLGDLRIQSHAKGGVVHHRLSWSMQDVAAP